MDREKLIAGLRHQAIRYFPGRMQELFMDAATQLEADGQSLALYEAKDCLIEVLEERLERLESA